MELYADAFIYRRRVTDRHIVDVNGQNARPGISIHYFIIFWAIPVYFYKN